MKPLVIYRANCTDGLGAAFAAWLKLGDDAVYLPMAYGATYNFDLSGVVIDHVGHEINGREVFILGFSFPREVMDDIFTHAKRVVWLEHHKDAFEMWLEATPTHGQYVLGGPNTVWLDNNKSGALLAWEYFHPGKEIPRLIQHIDAAANRAVISELLDRLEAAEKDIALKERVIDSLAAVVKRLDAQCDAAEKEHNTLRTTVRHEPDCVEAAKAEIKALRAKIEAAENDAAHQKALAASALRVAEGWERKCGELRAKIEQMERQRPFAWIVRGGYPVPLENLEWQLLCGAERPTLSWTNQEMRPLYALPGAQPKDEALWPTIANGMITPDGWKLVPIEPTPTMITAALESSHAINAHRAEYCYRAMIAVAPEAKP